MPLFFMLLFLSFSLRALIAQSVEHGANNAMVVSATPTAEIYTALNSLAVLDALPILSDLTDPMHVFPCSLLSYPLTFLYSFESSHSSVGRAWC